MTKPKFNVAASHNKNGKIDFSGSTSEEFSLIMINHVISSLSISHSNEAHKQKQVEAAMACLRGINPRDEIEGMLAVQMVGLHEAAMECMRRAMNDKQSYEFLNYNLNQANKLTRSYATMIETLQKYRGKGQQKMTVEHVHVNAGGQAIIGNVNNSGGSKNTKTEEQPHATGLNND